MQLLILLHPLCIIAEFAIIMTCLVGDDLLEQYVKNLWARALTDSGSHGLVALFSWMVVKGDTSSVTIIEIVFSGLFAISVDIDHFIAAASLHMQVSCHDIHCQICRLKSCLIAGCHVT